ncbi:hypothetical protein DV701_07520 [Ornithinimicrobium avium]|uniref:Uncharacterized protein n=1 Tax=Ornithinimicrobium avium TaxID=2283195 RepID=A0A345NLT7_9MICO|nr:hypothetical protein DV701_07520 [Ornithinimicrobium avium]
MTGRAASCSGVKIAYSRNSPSARSAFLPFGSLTKLYATWPPKPWSQLVSCRYRSLVSVVSVMRKKSMSELS